MCKGMSAYSLTIEIYTQSALSMSPLQTLTGHTGSVLCLQYDDKVIISGSSDATVRVWDVNSGELVNTLIHHCEAVLHLRFNNGMMVTCSKDRSIAVWDMTSPTEITLRRVLVGHRAAVNVVDFDEKYIVSASGDRTIKVWSTSSCEFVRTLNGHKRGIACLQYRDRLVVSGSSDNSIRYVYIVFQIIYSSWFYSNHLYTQSVKLGNRNFLFFPNRGLTAIILSIS